MKKRRRCLICGYGIVKFADCDSCICKDCEHLIPVHVYNDEYLDYLR